MTMAEYLPLFRPSQSVPWNAVSSFCLARFLHGRGGLVTASYQFNLVKIHQSAIERAVGLQTSELALLLFSAEEIVEAVALVKCKVTLFVVRIDE